MRPSAGPRVVPMGPPLLYKLRRCRASESSSGRPLPTSSSLWPPLQAALLSAASCPGRRSSQGDNDPSPCFLKMTSMARRCLCKNWSSKQFSAVRRFSSMIFVSRLPFYTTNDELKEAFSPFGEVTEARLVMDQRTKRHKGYGFVSYASEAEAQKAIKAMNNRIIGGRLIFVEVAKSTS